MSAAPSNEIRLPKFPFLPRSMEKCKAYPNIAIVVIAVCRHFNIEKCDIFAYRRAKDKVLPKHIAMYIASKITIKSSSEIGKVFKRDHSTILYACRKIERLRSLDSSISGHISTIEKSIKEVMEL